MDSPAAVGSAAKAVVQAATSMTERQTEEELQRAHVQVAYIVHVLVPQ